MKVVEKYLSYTNNLDMEKAFEIKNCGKFIKVSATIVVISCPTHNNNKGKVDIYYKETMSLMKTFEGDA